MLGLTVLMRNPICTESSRRVWKNILTPLMIVSFPGIPASSSWSLAVCKKCKRSRTGGGEGLETRLTSNSIAFTNRPRNWPCLGVSVLQFSHVLIQFRSDFLQLQTLCAVAMLTEFSHTKHVAHSEQVHHQSVILMEIYFQSHSNSSAWCRHELKTGDVWPWSVVKFHEINYIHSSYYSMSLLSLLATVNQPMKAPNHALTMHSYQILC